MEFGSWRVEKSAITFYICQRKISFAFEMIYGLDRVFVKMPGFVLLCIV